MLCNLEHAMSQSKWILGLTFLMGITASWSPAHSGEARSPLPGETSQEAGQRQQYPQPSNPPPSSTEDQPHAQPRETLGQPIQKPWKELSPAQRHVFMRHLRAWKKLSPEEKARLRQNFQHWKNLPPAQRLQIQKNHDRLQAMQPRKREHLFKNLQRWQAMTPEQREQLRRNLHAEK